MHKLENVICKNEFCLGLIVLKNISGCLINGLLENAQDIFH